MSIEFGQHVVDWMKQHMDMASGESLGLGLQRNGKFVAAVAYHGRRFHDVHASIVAMPGSMTKGFMKAIFHYPFNQLGVTRITVCVRQSNKPSIKLAKRMGFSVEGIKRKGYQDGENMVELGLLKEECKWLNL